MITQTLINDKKQVQRLWQQSFYHEDNGVIDIFFKKYYKSENMFVLKDGDVILSCAARSQNIMKLHDRFISTSIIIGICTDNDYRNNGYMSEVMETLIDHAEHQELVTLIQGYNPSIYKKYGFEVLYYQMHYELKRVNLPYFIDEDDIQFGASAQDMLSLYIAFVKRFNGFFIRDVEYYKNLISDVNEVNQKIICVAIEGVLKGYAIVDISDTRVIIKEIIYFDALTLVKICNYLLNRYDQIELIVSSHENFTKVFKDVNYIKKEYTMVRINDFELFNRLYNCKVDNIFDAMNLNNVPLYLNDWK